MTSNKFPFDVAIAGALGAVFALTLALTLGWSPYLWPIVGLIVGLLCYRPWELAITIAALSRDLWSAAQRWITIKSPLPKIGPVLAITGEALGCILLFCISLLALPTLAAVTIKWLTPTENMWTLMFQIMLGAMIIGGYSGLLTFATAYRQRWAMPISRLWVLPFFHLKGYAKESDTSRTRTCLEWTRKDTYQCCIFVAPCVHLCTLLILSLTIDLLVTIALACASTKRIAAMFGATLGCIAATIMATVFGITLPILLMTLGFVVGWCAGPIFYLLREYLATSPKTILVTS